MVLPRLLPATGTLLVAAALLILLGNSAMPAAAQDGDVYAVRDVEVDVTADSAAAARDRAIVEAQRKAFDKLLLTLSLPEEIGSLPPIGDEAIADMVLDFEIESESVSTVRYIGNMAFRFSGEPVRRYLEQGGASYAMSATRPTLVLPVVTLDATSLLWDDGNDWLAAWSRVPVTGTLVSLAVPLGDLTDISAVDAASALAGDGTALQRIAGRYRAGQVVVAEAKPAAVPDGGEARLDLDARLYGQGGLVASTQDSFTAPADEAAMDELYEQAAARVAAFVQEHWKQENLVSSTVEQRLAAVAPITSLEDWLDLQRRLSDVSTLRRMDLLRLSRSEARLDLVFVGDRAQLARALAQRDLSLSPTQRTATTGGTIGASAGTGQPAGTAGMPQTSGSVTVYPEAAVPPDTAGAAVPGAASTAMAGEAVWELRRGSPAPGADPSAAAQPQAAPPASDQPGAIQPAPIQPGATTVDPAVSPPAAE